MRVPPRPYPVEPCIEFHFHNSPVRSVLGPQPSTRETGLLWVGSPPQGASWSVGNEGLNLCPLAHKVHEFPLGTWPARHRPLRNPNGKYNWSPGDV